MPSAADVDFFLKVYDESVVSNARNLVERRKVMMLQCTDTLIEGDVRFEEITARASLLKKGNHWQGFCDDEENRETAICAVMLESEVHQVAAESSVTHAEKSLQELVEDKLSRQLSPSEEQYLAKVEKRYERYRALKEIYDHDLVRLNSRWPIQSYDALKLWPEPPANIVEFWNYLAAALIERKLTYPAFLEIITKLDETRTALDAWRKQADIPLWTERIREFSQRDTTETAAAELRLIITPHEARFQSRDVEGLWHTLTEPALDQLVELDQQNALDLPLHSRLILVSAARGLREEIHPIMRLENVTAARWLASLLLQRELSDHLLTLDEAPFTFAEKPLRWYAKENKGPDGKIKSISLRLCDIEGNDPPKPLRYLPAAESLYITTDTVFRGPATLEEDSNTQSSIEIPLEALATEEGIRFLQKLEVELPPSIDSRVTHESFRVNLTAQCLAKVEQGGTEHVAIVVEAVSSNGLLTQTLKGRRWEVTEQLRATDGAIPCYDRSTLDAVGPILENIKASYDLELDAFRARITKTFPENFHAWSQSLPETVTLSPDARLQTILADPLKATVRLQINEAGIDWFDLRLIFDIEGLELKPAEIRRLIAARGGFVRLADGTWRSVRLELSEEQQTAIEALGLDLNDLNDEAHPIHARQLALQERKEFIPPELWERVRKRLSELDLLTKPEVPEDLTITLRPYQVEGFQFLVYLAINRFGGVLADDMGLGKTVQSIAWVLWLRAQAREQQITPTPCVVICPKSVLDVWAVEFNKAAPALRVKVMREKDTLNLPVIQEEADVVVMNYAQLRSSIEELQKVNWLAAILDEGQQIKNPDSKVTKAARQLHAQNRLVLTGTPLENRLLDLWSLMTFATPGALGDRAYFQKNFDRRKDDRAAERLSSRLRPFILRRTKGQVARELPPRTEENILCELTGLQEKLYREQLAQAQHMILTTVGADALNKRRFAILQAITRLRQICCHPALVQPDASNEDSAKIVALFELLEQLHDEGHKVLVFSQFVSMLTIIRDKLIALKRPHHWLTGASQNRAEIVNGFQNDPNPSVFLLSLKAGGSGLNLTAASYVILYDPWWNPAVENQAIDRAHRIGQTQPVMAYRLLARNTIEEKIRHLQEQKSMLSNDVLGEESFARTLDKQDLEYLFSINDPVPDEE